MTERAWAAGFFDGEGTTCVGRSQTGISLHFTVGQKTTPLLERFQLAVGGRGAIGGHVGRELFRFRAYGREAHKCLQLLWPFLGEQKRFQALGALLVYTGRRVHRPGCQRGHDGPMYTRPSGGRECAICRDLRRAGLPLPPKLPPITAAQAHIGVREYSPNDPEPDLKWTWDMSEAEYVPTVET